MTLSVVLFLALVVIFTALAVTAPRRSRRRAPRHAEDLAASSGLALPDEVRPQVERSLARSSTVSAIGGLAGLLIAEAAVLLTPAGAGVTDAVFMAFVAGAPIGVVVATLVRRPPVPDGPRIARSRAVGLADFLHPVQRFGPWASVLVVAVTLSIAATGHERSAPAVALLAALTVVTAVLFETGGRRIVRESQVAASTTALAWDDALRARALRTLSGAPMANAVFAVFVAAVLPGVGTAGAVAQVPLCVAVGALAVAAVILIPRLRLQRHFLRRLWPETAAAGDALQASLDAHRRRP